MNKRHRSASSASSSASSPSTPSSPHNRLSRSPSPPSHKLPRPLPSLPSSSSSWSCSLPPTCSSHPTTFQSSSEFESHHRQFHSIVCHATQERNGKGKERECGCVFPQKRMLDLHHREFHDPLIAIQREQGIRTYECFLDPSLCQQKFKNPKGRRLHLIDVHHYPKEFFFAVIKEGIGKLLQSGDSSASLIQPSSRELSNSPTAVPYSTLPSLSPSNAKRPLPPRGPLSNPRPQQQPPPDPPQPDSPSDQTVVDPSSDIRRPSQSVDELVDIMSSASLSFVPRSVSKQKKGEKVGKKMVD